jgi:uncharacterized protein (DUF736 family)
VLVARGLAWDHVEALSIGLVFDRTESSVIETLQRARALSKAEWETMSRHARNYVEVQLDPVRLGKRIWQALTGQDAPAMPRQKSEVAL